MKIHMNNTLKLVALAVFTATSLQAMEGYKDANALGLELIEASKSRNLEELTRLLDEGGAHVDKQDEDGKTALMWAALDRDRPEFLQKLIDAKADLNIQDNDGYTALIHTVVVWNYVGSLEKLIEAKADLNIQDGDGRTALMWAALYGHQNSVQKLIDAGADISIEDNRGQTALTLAQFKKKIECVSALEKAELGLQLIEAAKENKPEHVAALIAEGVPVNIQDENGWTALMVAAYRGHTDCLQKLIAAGADLDLKNCHGNTALQLAKLPYTNKNIQECVALLENPIARNKNRDTKSTGNKVDEKGTAKPTINKSNTGIKRLAFVGIGVLVVGIIGFIAHHALKTHGANHKK